MGVTYYIMRENLIWREFNLAIFYDSPNRQMKVLAKFSGYTVLCISTEYTLYSYLPCHDIGASFYSFDLENSGLFPNNDIIVTNNFGQPPRIQCISGSQMAGVGQWITPDGQDVTRSTDDQFEVIVGGVNDPGYLDIALATGRSLTHNDQGVYTCLILMKREPHVNFMLVCIFLGLQVGYIY